MRCEGEANDETHVGVSILSYLETCGRVNIITEKIVGSIPSDFSLGLSADTTPIIVLTEGRDFVTLSDPPADN